MFRKVRNREILKSLSFVSFASGTGHDSVPKIDGRKDHDAYDRINDDAPHEASRRAIFSGCGQKRYNHQNDVEISQSFEKHFQLGFVHGRFILNSLFGLASEIIAMAFYIGPNLEHWILK